MTECCRESSYVPVSPPVTARFEKKLSFTHEAPREMQNVINTVKGTALGVAELFTPVLKVARS